MVNISNKSAGAKKGSDGINTGKAVGEKRHITLNLQKSQIVKK